MSTDTCSRGGSAIAAVFAVVLCIAVLGVVLCFTSGAVVSGGGSLIRGIGNSGNHFNPDPPEGRLADLIVAREIAGPIGDDVLSEVYDAVLTNARKGDADAALVIFEIADRQREMSDESQGSIEPSSAPVPEK